MLEILFNHLKPERFEEDINFYRSAGAAIEYCLDSPYLDASSSGPVKRQLGILKNSYNPRLSLHGPVFGFDPASHDAAVQELAWRRTQLLFEAAETADPEVMVFHSSYNPLPYGLEKRYWIDTTAEFWERALRFLPGDRAKVVVENIFDLDPAPLAAMLRRVNHPRFGFCLDIGHFNVFCRNISIEEYLAPFEGLPFHLHLHDNSGKKDEHLPPGEGAIDYGPLIALLEKRALPWTLTVECKDPESNEKAIAWAREHLGRCMRPEAEKTIEPDR